MKDYVPEKQNTVQFLLSINNYCDKAHLKKLFKSSWPSGADVQITYIIELILANRRCSVSMFVVGGDFDISTPSHRLHLWKFQACPRYTLVSYFESEIKLFFFLKREKEGKKKMVCHVNTIFFSFGGAHEFTNSPPTLVEEDVLLKNELIGNWFSY